MEAGKAKIKLIYLLILIVIIVVGATLLITAIVKKGTDEKVENTAKITENTSNVVEDKPKKEENYHIEEFENEDYYIIDDDYDGEYEIQNVGLYDPDNEENDFSDFEVQEVMNYEEYTQFCEEWDIEQNYDDEDLNYIVFSYTMFGPVRIDVRLAEVEYNKKTATLYVWDDSYGVTADRSSYVIFVPTTEEVTKVKIQELYDEEQFEIIQDGDRRHDTTIDKPIIYLYPEEEKEVSIELKYKDKITTSYPKYNEAWKVLAKPNGDLVDLQTNRNLYALYYESESVINFGIEKDGFIVKGEEAREFLEEKLAILGLNEREAEEFIVYWLPKLEANEYNYIRFATNEEIEENMPLEVNPNPDTVIRVLMTYKGIDEPIEVEEQKLETPERKGFVVVEWGGTEL